MDGPLLVVSGLNVEVGGAGAVLSGVDLAVGAGEAVGLAGESGSGKTMLALAVAGLLPPVARVTGGEVHYRGENLLTLPPRRRRDLLGREIAMVFQEPMTALHPALTVGFQVAEAVRRTGATRREAWKAAVALLGQTGIPEPERRAKSWPHQLSGGMRQRVAIAIALAQHPSLLLADEPTTALDVTIQREILDLLRGLREDLGLALLLITHDLAVLAETVDRLVVMYAGRAVEKATAIDLFPRPRHPYTLALLRALPGRSKGRLEGIPGTVPPPGSHPPGCVYAPRCAIARPHCNLHAPDLDAHDGPGLTACHFSSEVGNG